MTFHKNKTILTFVWSHKGPRRAKATLKKENGPEASPSLTSTLRYEATVTKKCGIGTKTGTQSRGTEQRAQESTYRYVASYSQERSQEHTPGKGQSPQ